MAFEKIIGNQKVKDTLNTAIKKNNILHSYLFSGQEGIGKFLFAKEFCGVILCNNVENLSQCKKCKSCIEFESGNNQNFNCLEPDGNAIKIEQIRNMNIDINERPVGNTKKVYIIRDCEKMTREAQNSLLKTLEEPPSYAVIILVTKQESAMLNTIKSRCTKIQFQNLTDDEILNYFKSNEKEISRDIISISEGSIKKAIQRMEKKEIYYKLKYFIENIENIDKIDVLKQNFIYEEKDEIQDLLEIMNIILFQIAKEKKYFLECISSVESTKKNLKLYGNFDMCIDNLLLGIWEEINEKRNRS